MLALNLDSTQVRMYTLRRDLEGAVWNVSSQVHGGRVYKEETLKLRHLMRLDKFRLPPKTNLAHLNTHFLP